MSNVYNTMTTLGGLTKEIYGDEVVSLLPKFAWMQENIPLEEAKMVGNAYHQPVLVTHEHGFTYSKAANGAFTINDSEPAIMLDATVAPSQILGNFTIDYETAYRSAGGGKKAFMDGAGQVIKNALESARKRVELELLYGQTGLGAVNAATSSTTTFVISEATWSPGIWAGMKNAYIQIINADYDADEDTTEKIASIAPSTRSIVVTNNQTLDAGDLVYSLGQVTSGSADSEVHHSMVGLNKLSTATSGTLFGINVATYADAFQCAPEQTSTGEPTMARLMAGVSEVVNRGCMEDLVCLCSPRMFERLNSDLSILRRFDNGYRHSKAESGVENIEFFGMNGRLSIVPHLFVKWGDAFIFPPKRLKRIGSTDLTMRRPAGDGKTVDIFRESTSNAGFEFRVYTGQALFPERLNWFLKLSGITYS